jgi:hypothetical protein
MRPLFLTLDEVLSLHAEQIHVFLQKHATVA